MKYNAKYDRWVSKDGLIYRYDKKNDKLVLCKLSVSNIGYSGVKCSKPCRKVVSTHRMVYETFVGEIPQGYEIDHINTIRDDNRLENLRIVTHKENLNNPLTRKHKSDSLKGKVAPNKGVATSDFGKKFKTHFGFTQYENPKLYHRELMWYYNHNKACRWEIEDK